MKPSFVHLIFNSYLIVISLLCKYCSMNSDAIYHYCNEAAKRDPNFTSDFCVSSLEANPKSLDIETLEELVSISIDLTISNATNIISLIKHLISTKDLDAYATRALKDCDELYSDAESTLHDVMDDFEAKDYMKANLDVSLAMDSSTTCEDGFKDKDGEVSPLSKENNGFFQLTAMVLTFLSMLSS